MATIELEVALKTWRLRFAIWRIQRAVERLDRAFDRFPAAIRGRVGDRKVTIPIPHPVVEINLDWKGLS